MGFGLFFKSGILGSDGLVLFKQRFWDQLIYFGLRGILGSAGGFSSNRDLGSDCLFWFLFICFSKGDFRLMF